MEKATIISETCKRLEELGGKSIEIVDDRTITYDGMTEYWKTNNTNKNIIRYNGDLPASNHLIMHELTHLSMFINNTIAGKGKRVMTSNDSRALLFTKYADAWEKIGIRNKMSPQAIAGKIGRCCIIYSTQILNLSLDLFVERLLFEKYPSLRNEQGISISRMEKENIASDTSPYNRNIPPQLVRNSRILNTARALQCKELFGLNTVNKHPTSPNDSSLAYTMYEEFKSTWDSYQPGDEYDLALYYAECLDWEDILCIKDE